MNINPMSTCAALVGEGRDLAGAGNAVTGYAFSGAATMTPAGPRTAWARNAATVWAEQRDAVTDASAFSAHHVSLKPRLLPREVLCLT
jgi:hypothetical protein